MSEASSVFTPLPAAPITVWALPPVGSAAASDSHRSANPTMICTASNLGCVIPRLGESNDWCSEVELRR